MRLPLTVVAGLAAALPQAAHAANIYMLSSTDGPTDAAAASALTALGHSVTVGVPYTLFDGTVSLAGFDTVYLQANFNWTGGPMSPSGQAQIVDFVQNGGRLVTSEWAGYYSASNFSTLGAVMPIVQTFTYGSFLSTAFDQVTPDPQVTAGVPVTFSVTLTSYTGTELHTAAKPGATVYYTTQNSPGAVALAGWAQGSGVVFSFTSTCGPDQVGDPNFARLFANVMGVGGNGCYPNCDGSTQAPVLNVADFGCFLTRYAAGEPYANCDGSTQAPVLNVADFGCFLTRYAAGCR
ncbi:MAG: GC-type dockerin domain-anchored protein [Phycisphaerales bacterium]